MARLWLARCRTRRPASRGFPCAQVSTLGGAKAKPSLPSATATVRASSRIVASPGPPPRGQRSEWPQDHGSASVTCKVSRNSIHSVPIKASKEPSKAVAAPSGRPNCLIHRNPRGGIYEYTCITIDRNMPWASSIHRCSAISFRRLEEEIRPRSV
jgi:hypothetical protein